MCILIAKSHYVYRQARGAGALLVPVEIALGDPRLREALARPCNSNFVYLRSLGRLVDSCLVFVHKSLRRKKERRP